MLYHLAKYEKIEPVNQILENMHPAYVNTKQIYSIPSLLELYNSEKHAFTGFVPFMLMY